MVKRLRHTLAAASLVFLLVPTVTVQAAEATMPLPVPAPERFFNGYDWAARIDSTHIVLDAKGFASSIHLDKVPTELIDLEMTGLMPWSDGTQPRSYRLVGPARTIVGYADGSGSAIFWNVPAAPGAWVLTDGRSSEPVTTITMEPRTFQPSMTRSWCFWCSQRYEPPQPVSSEDLEGGMVIEQAAYSFTPDVAIQVIKCWRHQVTVAAKASGGLAGSRGTAGGDYSYSAAECGGFTSQGQPAEYLRKAIFRRDTYEDNSTKIYAVGKSGDTRFAAPDLYYAPPPEARAIEVEAGSVGPHIVLKEAHAGGVFFEAGAHVFGTGLGVSFAAQGETETEVTFTFAVPATGIAKYKFYAVNGDFTDDQDPRGIVAMAWKVPE